MKNEVEFVQHIVTSLTGEPDCFTIERSVDERGVLLTLSIEEMYAGRVIGKKAQTILAIRDVLRALGHKNNARYSLLVEVRE